MPELVPTLTLGDFEFTDFAVPEFIRMLGPERHNVHREPGGARQIDMLGRDDEPYQWRGQFVGAQAANLAIALDALRTAAGVYDLTFGQWTQPVVITKLIFHYRRENWVEYEIECTPVFTVADNPAAAVAPQADVNAAANAGGP